MGSWSKRKELKPNWEALELGDQRQSRQKPRVGKSREGRNPQAPAGPARRAAGRTGPRGAVCLALKESVCLWNVCVLGQKCKLATGLPSLP